MGLKPSKKKKKPMKKKKRTLKPSRKKKKMLKKKKKMLKPSKKKKPTKKKKMPLMLLMMISNTAGCPSSTSVLPSDGVLVTTVSTRMSTLPLLWVAKKSLEDSTVVKMVLSEVVSMLVESMITPGERDSDMAETILDSLLLKKKRKRKKKMAKLLSTSE